MVLPVLGIIGAVGARVAPLLPRVAGLVENKLNLLGLTVAGAVGWVVNERNQDRLDKRHQQALEQDERQHQQTLAQQAQLNANLLDAVRTGHSNLSEQMRGVERDVGEAKSRLIGLDTGMRESHAVLSRIMMDVSKTSTIILQCTREDPTGQRLPTRELVLQ